MQMCVHIYVISRHEFWYMLEEFFVRLGKIDKVRFITSDVVNALMLHLQKIRLANTKYVLYLYQVVLLIKGH